MYADDLVIFSPSSVGLRALISVCEKYGISHEIRFNYKKSAIMICRGQFMKNVQLYARGNVLLRKCHMCSMDVKVKLFDTYCSPMYTAQLWWNHSCI